MRKVTRLITSASAVATMLTVLAVPQVAVAEEKSMVEQGKELAFDRRKGNCLACHQIEGGTLPGNIGPPLVAMQARFPNKAEIRSQLWNPLVKNPNSAMPPFGLHEILTEQELDKIIEYVYTL